MPDASALLAAIASNPDDDLPRLVYADWLDEHGDADRAEFIRLQCHTARVGPLDPTWAPAKLREFDLFKANEAKWRPKTVSKEGGDLLNYWRRGFPARVDMWNVIDRRFTAGEWCNGAVHWKSTLDHRPGMSPRLPLGPVRDVRFSEGPPGSRILHHELLRAVRSISLTVPHARRGAGDLENFAAELAALPPSHFPELRTLNLIPGELTLHALEALAGASLLNQLTGLHLNFPSEFGPDTSVLRWRDATGRLFDAIAPRLECFGLYQLPPFLIEEFSAAFWTRLRSLFIMHAHEVGLPAYDFSRTPSLTALGIFTHPFGGGRNANPLQAFDEGWPEQSLKVLALGKVPVDELRPWLAYPERFSLDFLSANVTGGRLRTEELTTYPLTRGLKGLAGSFTKAGFVGLRDAAVLPELHTIWNTDALSPSDLRWRGGRRTVIAKDDSVAAVVANGDSFVIKVNQSRSQWCGWGDQLLG